MAWLNVAGFVLALVALVLAWVWARGVPSVEWSELRSGVDQFVIRNSGPGDAQITRAVAMDLGEEMPAGEAPEGVVVLDERLGGWSDPYCKGAVLPVSFQFVVTVGTNCDLRITYRAAGRLGWFSRKASITVEGHL